MDHETKWVDYNPQKKQFVRTPSLPAWAVPKAKGTETISQDQGKAVEAMMGAGMVKWEDFAEHFQIVSLGQLPKASLDEVKAWLTGCLDAAAKRSA
jgi:hypothetical protein